jgi:type II secretory ATPase GspE/PulE/Tfp pilus assembly ATPase PilB-like protein
MVVAQRLVRKLCPGCKEPQQLNDATMARLGIPAEGLKFYVGRGCPACSGLGYLGRIVLGEVLVLSPSIRELIMKQESERAIKSAAKLEGFKSLREDGLEKAGAGIISLEEVFHASADDNLI